jgi:hypothetical protein
MQEQQTAPFNPVKLGAVGSLTWLPATGFLFFNGGWSLVSAAVGGLFVAVAMWNALGLMPAFVDWLRR